MSIFTPLNQDSFTKARTGILHLPHGPVETPAFMPVGTNGTVKAISLESLEQMKVNLILGNSYHLYLRPGMKTIAEAGGLHGFMTWHGNILTDSGGYQVFSLARLRKLNAQGVVFQSHIDGSRHELTPEKVVEIQHTLGSDICMPLDVCTSPGIEHSDAENASRTTGEWLKRSKNTWQILRSESWQGTLFGIVQGNFFPDLRRQSAIETSKLDLPGIAIGGLSVGEPFQEFQDMLEHTVEHIPTDIPHYLMGIGTPEYILTAVKNGIDMFDCVFPTRTARNGQLFTRSGPINIKKERYSSQAGPVDNECKCPVCLRYSRAYLRHLFKAKEIFGIMLATRHNLQFLRDFVQEIRDSIKADVFTQYMKSFLALYHQNGR